MRSVYCYYYHYAHDARRNRRREGKHHFQGHTVTQLLSEWFQTCIHAVWLQGHSSQALNLYENYGTVYMTSGFPDGSVVKNLSANAGDARDLIPGFGKIPWRRKWQPTAVFLPGESPWTEEPGGLQSTGLQRVSHDGVTEHACTHTGLV